MKRYDVYEVLMDSSIQQELMNNPEHPDVELLSYVYDSKLRAQLDKEEKENKCL